MNKLHGLYGITSQAMLLDPQQLLTKTEQALRGGMQLLQYRNKHQPCPQSLSELQQLQQLCHDYHAIFIINDDIVLCQSLSADGVHLGKDDGNVSQARQQLGKHAVIGVSCYNDFSLAQQAEQQGASYVAFGAFYPSPTKPNAQRASIQRLQQAQQLSIPSCAIGGITTDNAKPLIKAGSDMIAVINDLFEVPETQQQAEIFSSLF